MKKNIFIIMLLTVYTFLQYNLINPIINFDTMESYSIMYQPFITLFEYNLTIQLIQIVLLLATFLMLFMGVVRKDLYQTGIYYIIRYDSKKKWLNKHLFKISLKLFILVLIYTTIGILFSYIVFGQIGDFNLIYFIEQLLIFYLVFLSLLQIQIMLEIYQIETVANAIVLILSFVMINFYPTIIDKGLNILKIFAYTNNLSILRSGVLQGEGISKVVLLILINLICYIVNMILIKRKDIY